MAARWNFDSRDVARLASRSSASLELALFATHVTRELGVVTADLLDEPLGVLARQIDVDPDPLGPLRVSRSGDRGCC